RPEDFLAKLVLLLPTVSVRLADQSIACRTFVGSQCQGLTVSAVLQSANSLAPIHDLSLGVELRRTEGDVVKSVPLHLAATQLQGRQALLTANLPRPRRLGAWEVAWILDDLTLATVQIKVISKTHFHRSLRLAS